MDHLIQFWPILKRLIIYAIPWKKKIILAFFLLLSGATSEVLGPILISYFINNILSQHQLNFQLILIIIVIFIMLQILAVFFNYFQSILFNKIAVGIVNKLRNDVMKAALNQPISEFDSQPIGQMISKVTNDTEVIKELYDTVGPTFFRSITLIIIILFAMFTLEWHMAIITIFIIPLVIIVMSIYQYYSTPLLRNVRYYVANINNKFNETINGMNVIQQFRQQTRFENNIKESSELHYLARMKILKLDGFLLRPLLSLLSALVLCSFMFLFSYFSIGVYEVGVLYAFITYLGRLNEPLISITIQQSILQQAIVAGERIFSLIDSPKQKYGNNEEEIKSGKINIKNLSFKYKESGENILNNINIYIPSKSFVAFVGQTGSGKSTLANLLMGYYPIKHGKIYLDDKSINCISHDVLRKNILMVQQDPIVLADTFSSNITLGKKISEEKIWNVLKTVHLSSLVQSMPKGIYSILGEEGNNLSLGQKQLLAIARILVRNPKILILDEATANIDSGTEKLIQTTLSSIRAKTTLVVIAHRLSTVIEADMIVVLKKGKIVELGTHKQLLEKKGFYWKMYNFQLFNC
ncbi:SmdB family multidrug efflux ABC transporter permease/ATP-binding protein [Buchnera aphidicola]|jgi:ATP-binding cassette subfamily C protein|uniref:Multidrug resistance-like ATP-binding protein MdlB n=1 Tax=Buchnera aphidicola subsp. Schizaphis graminum (strain Sg) TaxID=198804 RepID=MDLB_BUCAP|nr:SmdB family multidrug efflux ABC transporter permease/ATP-binding protein [Buchnera aphidicola]Q8K984.1 RecName: Full=Multidrug resistance-like ATP-binding protein MdlB [Buchnera aphidicola str. Sg (Schizaphis graminum)]AAM68008.1 multidrug resistance-like ATP-binding protein [Buchnera aphidicola str. Sg (Schizaphis graminum)]AWI49502.1 multidrug ABC transporter permease/ATP-binding protein [Buchnera aphidicola (Schizaphis graminum)]